MMRWMLLCVTLLAVVVVALGATTVERGTAFAADVQYFTPGPLRPTDSALKVKVGDAMPDFDLPALGGGRARLADYLGKKNLVISFIPAAWTPVCSGQWPGYNIAKDLFEGANTALVGISVDNLPTLFAWVQQMGGLWFPVASDFWPHGGLAGRLGVLRSEGTAERALFLIDMRGVIRFIDVHDINKRPDLGELVKEMQALR